MELDKYGKPVITCIGFEDAPKKDGVIIGFTITYNKENNYE